MYRLYLLRSSSEFHVSWRENERKGRTLADPLMDLQGLGGTTSNNYS
jgi:hypothetical protein